MLQGAVTKNKVFVLEKLKRQKNVGQNASCCKIYSVT